MRRYETNLHIYQGTPTFMISRAYHTIYLGVLSLFILKNIFFNEKLRIIGESQLCLESKNISFLLILEYMERLNKTLVTLN